MKFAKFKAQGRSLLITVLFIGGVVLLNVFFGYLDERFYLKIDVTKNGIYSITESTQRILADLPYDVKLTVFSDESVMTQSPGNVIMEILNKYAAYSGGRITIDLKDPDNSDFAGRYPAVTLTSGDILVESENRYTSVSMLDMLRFNYSSGQYVLSGVQAEEYLTGAILFSMSEVLPRAVFTEGHGETTANYSELRSLVSAAQFQTQTARLATEELPGDTSLVVICGPLGDFTGPELERLDAFMKAGGSAVYLANPDAVGLDNLNAYLLEWGISVEEQVVYDTQEYTGVRPQILLNLTDNGVTDSIRSKEIKPITSYSAPITVVDMENGLAAIPIFTSSENSYAKIAAEVDPNNWEIGELDAKGPFNMGVLCVYEDSEAGSGLFVTTQYFVANTYLQSSSFINREILTGLLAYFNPDHEMFTVDARAAGDDMMPISGGHALVWLAVLAVFLPLFIFAAGIVVWRKRKNQ